MTTALYRRYRPETFEEVIGEDQVTVPLMQALRTGRVNHAYLFSGPRGCGKTTSARILARVLNCAQNTEAHPIATPCGQCESCIELGRDGTGSLDVVEIDAASHGGVDSARDLRDRAAYRPTRDRFKIYILDEAHMVTKEGFNSLLKIVEEPPPYLKFIFATTEPEKVIGTIRSRTHNYPFRLVPPEVLQPYLASICEAEGATADTGVLPLVLRAGGGSVRDSLSVLDQLIAGAPEGHISYHLASALLGFTPLAVLNDAIDAYAAGDGAGLFSAVEQVIVTGIEPRRFVEDMLTRFRDLIVLSVSGDQADAVFSSTPEAEREHMAQQAHRIGFARLTTAAELANATLSEMSGATSPRLHLELLCAQLLVRAGSGAPVARAVSDAGAPPSAQASAAPSRGRPEPGAAPAPTHRPAPVAAANPAATSAGSAAPAAHDTPPTAAATPAMGAAPETQPAPASDPAGPMLAPAEPAVVVSPIPAPAEPAAARTSEPAADAEPVEPAAAAAGSAAEAQTADAVASLAVPVETVDLGQLLRRRWDEVLETAKQLRRATWSLVSQNASVGRVADNTVTLLFTTEGIRDAFWNKDHAPVMIQAITETLGIHVTLVGEIAAAGGTESATHSVGGRAAQSGPARTRGATSAPQAADTAPEPAPTSVPPWSSPHGEVTSREADDLRDAAAASWGAASAVAEPVTPPLASATTPAASTSPRSPSSAPGRAAATRNPSVSSRAATGREPAPGANGQRESGTPARPPRGRAAAERAPRPRYDDDLPDEPPPDPWDEVGSPADVAALPDIADADNAVVGTPLVVSMLGGDIIEVEEIDET